EAFRQIWNLIMDFRTASDVPDFSFNKDLGIDRLECLHILSSLANVLCEWQYGEVKDHCIEPRLPRLNGFRQRVRMISVQKDREIEFLPKAAHERAKLTHSHKLALALRCTDDNWNLKLPRGGEY